MSIKNSVLTSIRWAVSAKLAGQTISWICTFFVMRLLQPNDYGLLAMSMVLISFFSMISEAGLGQAIVQAKSVSRRELSQCFGFVILINIATIVLLFLTAPLAASYFQEPRVATLVPFLSLQFLIQIFSTIPAASLEREMNFRFKSINEIACAVIGALASLGLALSGAGVWALVFGNLLSVTIGAVVLNIKSPFLVMPSFRIKGIGGIANYGLMTVINRLLWYVYSQADVFIVGRILGKTALGYYSVGIQLASLPLIKMSVVFNQIGLAAFSRIQDDKNLVGKYSLTVARLVSLFTVPVFLGMSVVADELVLLVLGEHWRSAATPLRYIGLMLPLRALSIPLAQAVNACGMPRLNVINLSIACVVMPAAFLVGIHFWQLEGICYAWVAVYPIWFLYVLNQGLPVVGLTKVEYFKAILPPFAAGGAMLIAVHGVRLALPSQSLAVVLAAMIACGAFVYIALMLTCLRKYAFDTMAALRSAQS